MARKPTFSHNHVQSVEASQWVIPHGFFSKPSVAVQVHIEGSLQTIIPHSISYPDESTVVIGFTRPFSGTARLV